MKGGTVFIRGKVEQGLEAYAQRHGIDVITPEVMQESLAGDGRARMFGGMPLFRKGVAKPEDGAD